MNGQKPPSQKGCSWATDCIEICNGRSVNAEDRGVRATFRNPRKVEVRKVHYDGCYFTGTGKRADFILGLPETIDVIVELKGTDTNLKIAAQQVEETLSEWRLAPERAPAIAGLIIYGRIEGRKKLPGRLPRTSATILGLRAEFLKRLNILLLIHQNGETRFTFKDFIR